MKDTEDRLDDAIQEQSISSANEASKVDITIPIEESLDGSLPEESSSTTDEAKGFAGVTRRTWIVGGAALVVFLIAVLLSALLVGTRGSSVKSSLDQQQTSTLFSSSSQAPSSMPSSLLTIYPTLRPTSTPLPSNLPSDLPSDLPSNLPSDLPSMVPSFNPSTVPTAFTSSNPSFQPTSGPTVVLSSGPSAGPTTYTGISTFFAIGDVPYNARDAVKLEEQMSTIPEDARFVIHLGDLRSANEGLDCVRSDYTDVASILRLSRAPVFAVIGDNDWNDCPNRNQGRNFWENEFNGFDTKYWNHTFQVVRQPERTENFAFVDQGTLFIGLNIVGGLVHDRNEWETRLTDQVKWTKNLIREYNPTDRVGSVVIFGHANPTQNHNAFFVPLTDFIANELQNQLPILYLNGDKHTWNYEPSFFDQPSFLRITVTGGTSEPPLKVSAETGRSAVEEVFTYDRQL